MLAFVAAGFVRSVEKRRLGYTDDPRHRWVALGALVGAAVGAKLGMVLFVPFDDFRAVLGAMASLDFSGQTVIGGLVGGYIGVEIAKKLVGIDYSTGDSFAVAVPVGQAIGRLGCFVHGCCWGEPTDVAWAVAQHDALRHPTQLYEAVALIVLAGSLWMLRRKPYPQGHLFRRYIVGYALIRFVVEFWRGDPSRHLGLLTWVQVVCLVAAAVFTMLIIRGERASVRSATASV